MRQTRTWWRQRIPQGVRAALLVMGVGLLGLVRSESAQEPYPPLAPDQRVEGVITTQPLSYGIHLTAGQFLRLAGTGRGLLLRLIGPRGDTIQETGVMMLSYFVQETGLHRLEVDQAYGLLETRRSVARSYNLQVDELLSPTSYTERLKSLRSDARVAWLRQHVIPTRSPSDDDTDFSDLRPLRDAIGDARVVLIGEESHQSGSVIRVNSRLVRFLHQEMGFDVLALESSLFRMWKDWQLMQARQVPADWLGSVDHRPLTRYIIEQAAGLHPLEIAGVDYQDSGDLSSQQLVSQLAEIVARERLGEEGKNLVPGFWAALSAFVRASIPKPPPPEVISDLRSLAERLAAAGKTRSIADGRTLQMWAQVARNFAEYMGYDSFELYNDHRDRQMDRNLAWLGQVYYPGRKIIFWAANTHVLRHPDRLPQQTIVSRIGMDRAVREVFGDRSFVIVATAHGGQYRASLRPTKMAYTVVSDQDPSFEMEELLAETGVEQAVVLLREVPTGGEWLRSPIRSRIWAYKSILGTWPEHADAILFMRTVTPRAPTPEAP